MRDLVSMSHQVSLSTRESADKRCLRIVFSLKSKTRVAPDFQTMFSVFKMSHLETFTTTRLSLSSLVAGFSVSSMKVFILLQMSRGARLTFVLNI